MEHLLDTDELSHQYPDLYANAMKIGNHHEQRQTMTASPYYCVIVKGNLDSFEYAVVTEKIRLERRIP